jgi:predicted secreted protein
VVHTRHRFIALSLAVLAVVAMAACGSDKKSPSASDTTADADTTDTTLAATTATTSATGDLVLQASDTGLKRTVAVGKTVTILLDVNGGTGYSWDITTKPDPAILEVVSQNQAKKSTGSDGGPPIAGGPETLTTILKAKAPGQTTIELSLDPPGGGAADSKFSVDITVTA